MFRTGIGAGFVESIEVGGSDSRDGIIAELRSMGLEEIDGKPIEEVVILRKTPPSEATPDSTVNWDVFNQSPEESSQEAQPETTPETISSEPWPDWPDDWGNWDESFSTPTSPPESPSESVDDWM